MANFTALSLSSLTAVFPITAAAMPPAAVISSTTRFAPSSLMSETTTLAPIDLDAVDPQVLTPAAREALNRYHLRVREALTPYLNEEEAQWLKTATRSI